MSCAKNVDRDLKINIPGLIALGWLVKDLRYQTGRGLRVVLRVVECVIDTADRIFEPFDFWAIARRAGVIVDTNEIKHGPFRERGVPDEAIRNVHNPGPGYRSSSYHRLIAHDQVLSVNES